MRTFILMLMVCFPLVCDAWCYTLIRDGITLSEESFPPFSLDYSIKSGFGKEYLESKDRGEVLIIDPNECHSVITVASPDYGPYQEPIKNTESKNNDQQGTQTTHRSSAARYQFEKANPCPSTGNRFGPCPGFIIDHIIPLACGGPDSPGNMQWQTYQDSLAKDRWERNGC